MHSPPDILKKILHRKTEEIAERIAYVSYEDMLLRAAAADSPRGFFDAIRTKIDAGRAAVVAEIKKASPSRGILRPEFEPAEIAESYAFTL